MSDTNLAIPRPDGRKEPLKVNVFAFGRFANTTLSALFPYVQSGDIAPALTKIQGGRPGGYGYFEHRNTVDEIILCIAGEGGYLRSGELTAGPREHGVSSFLADETNPESYGLFVVTQRQDPTEAEQEESFILRCTNCQNQLYRMDYAGRDTMPDAFDEVFMTPYRCGEGAAEFNSAIAHRTCSECGTVAPEFPAEAWGWPAYHNDVDLARRARTAAMAAAAAAGRKFAAQEA